MLGRRVTCWPSRSTTTVAAWSPLARISRCTWLQLVTSAPLKETKRSPGLNPATFAGASTSPAWHGRGALSRLAWVTAITHWETASTVVVGFGTPWPMKMIANSTKAMTMLIVTPDPMMMTRCHHGLL